MPVLISGATPEVYGRNVANLGGPAVHTKGSSPPAAAAAQQAANKGCSWQQAGAGQPWRRTEPTAVATQTQQSSSSSFVPDADSRGVKRAAVRAPGTPSRDANTSFEVSEDQSGVKDSVMKVNARTRTNCTDPNRSHVFVLVTAPCKGSIPHVQVYPHLRCDARPGHHDYLAEVGVQGSVGAASVEKACARDRRGVLGVRGSSSSRSVAGELGPGEDPAPTAGPRARAQKPSEEPEARAPANPAQVAQDILDNNAPSDDNKARARTQKGSRPEIGKEIGQKTPTRTAEIPRSNADGAKTAKNGHAVEVETLAPRGTHDMPRQFTLALPPVILTRGIEQVLCPLVCVASCVSWFVCWCRRPPARSA